MKLSLSRRSRRRSPSPRPSLGDPGAWPRRRSTAVAAATCVDPRRRRGARGTHGTAKDPHELTAAQVARAARRRSTKALAAKGLTRDSSGKLVPHGAEGQARHGRHVRGATTVKVYWHTNHQRQPGLRGLYRPISKQISVLNSAYSGTGVQFLRWPVSDFDEQRLVVQSVHAGARPPSAP